MLIAAIFAFTCYIVVWLAVAAILYSLLFLSLIYSYLFEWDDKTRKEICPHGLWSALIHNR